MKLVCVDTTAVRIPPEVHSVPTLWDSARRRLVVGPQILEYLGTQATPPGPPGSGGGGGGGSGGILAGFDGGGMGSLINGDGGGGLGAGGGPVFASLQDAYGGGSSQASGGEAGRAAAAELTRATSHGEGALDMDKYQAQRDAELRNILSGQSKPV